MSAPVVAADGTIYCAGEDALVRAISPNGQVKWTRKVAKALEALTIGAGGLLYLVDDSGALHSLEADGAPRWISTYAKFDTVPSPYEAAPPAIGADGTVCLGELVGNRLISLSVEGDVRWEIPLGMGIVKVSVASAPNGELVAIVSPASFDGPHPDAQLWFMSSDGVRRRSVAVGKGSYGPAVVDDAGTMYLKRGVRGLGAVGEDGVEAWQIPGFLATIPGIARDGTVRAAFEGALRSLNRDGSVRWTFPTDGYSVGGALAIDAAGTTFFGTDTTFYAVGADGTMQWSLPMDVPNAPAIGADGTLYVTARASSPASKLYAIGPGNGGSPLPASHGGAP